MGVEAVTSPTGVTDPAAAAAAAAATGAPAAGAPGSTTAAAPAIWTDSLSDPGLRDFAINKGYNKGTLNDTAPVILQQYQNLEKLFGAEKAGRTVELPDFEKADEAALNAYYERTGRPKEAKDYKLEIPVEGKVDAEFSAGMAGLLHKAGISGRSATIISKGYQEFSAARDAANLAATQQRFADEDKSLKVEWGAKYDNNLSVASAAAKALGVPPEAIDALQKAGGYGVAMKTFYNIAARIGEDQFITGDGAGNTDAKMTPAEASAELAKLQADKDWMASWMDKAHPKHKEAMARKTFLTSMMAAGQAA